MENSERRTDLRVVKTRRRVISALIELMSGRGIAKISVSELCVKAEINRKTFYRHYGTIADVVTELENGLLEEFAEVFKSHNSNIFDIGTVFRDISAVVDSRRDFFLSLLKHNPDLFSKGRLKAALCKMVEGAVKNMGTAEDEKSIAAAAEFAVSGALALYTAWFDGNCTEDLSFLTGVAEKMVTKGLSAMVINGGEQGIGGI